MHRNPVQLDHGEIQKINDTKGRNGLVTVTVCARSFSVFLSLFDLTSQYCVKVRKEKRENKPKPPYFPFP